jgi:hypothetical protein
MRLIEKLAIMRGQEILSVESIFLAGGKPVIYYHPGFFNLNIAQKMMTSLRR